MADEHYRYYPDGSKKLVPARPPQDATSPSLGSGLAERARQIILGRTHTIDQLVDNADGPATPPADSQPPPQQ